MQFNKKNRLQLFMLFLIVLQTVGTEAAVRVNILKYGAKGDDKTLNTNAINKAITDCARQGGGTVVIPSGIFQTGTVQLKSHVSLFLEKGAIIKGTTNLKEYIPYIPTKEMGKYDNADKYNWNRALILGVGVNNISISGEGLIDGAHVVDPVGEENMRGPHTILFGESRNLTLSGIGIDRAANYAFMAYEVENVVFQNLTIKEGWDGIHIRGGKNMLIRNCEFYTGDDAIAGGYWENMTITDCLVNSSCNGIRMIMPATGLTIAHCSFKGPGLFPHRTSKEKKRTNMLSAVLLQPGGWGSAPGRMEKIHIHDLEMENLDNPFLFILNQGNEGGDILVERIKASHITQSASSVESWKGGSFDQVVFRDISLEYEGHNSPEYLSVPVGQPHVDSRVLPCWGWFIRNVRQLTLENIILSYTGQEVRPAFYFDNVGTVVLKNVQSREVPGVNPIRLQDSGAIKNSEIIQFIK